MEGCHPLVKAVSEANKTLGTHEPVFLEHFRSAFPIPLLVVPWSDTLVWGLVC